jgi:putative flippase GtrA
MRVGSRYLVVGVWNSLFGISIFFILSLALPNSPDLLVLGCSYLISIIQAHFTQRRLVWSSISSYIPELVRFGSAYALQFVINVALLALSEMWLPKDRELRQTVIIVFLTLVFYFVNKKGVFRVTQ